MNIKAPQGNKITCKGWHQEAAMRMLMNNLDPDVAEQPDKLIVYGGTGKAARNWESYHAIIKSLQKLENDQTLLIQSGKPVGIFRTFEHSPRVLIANSNLVPKWANWEHFNELERKGLMMYGQMTAGSWIYIGAQGIIQGTYETFASLAQKHFDGTLKNKLVLTGGMGGMGGAQPLAITMNGGVALVVEVDIDRIKRRMDMGLCDRMTSNLDEALKWSLDAKEKGEPLSIALEGNCADILPKILQMNIIPDVVTDQTSAHDELNGYVPGGMSFTDALELRKSNSKEYIKRSMSSMAKHTQCIVEFQKSGAIAFDYGNNLRGQALKTGYEQAFAYPGFVPAYIRPLFCEGKGPFRWAALSGKKEDIHATDKVLLELFPENQSLKRWIKLAQQKIPFQGLPSRICWLGYGERALFGKKINSMVANGEISAPIVIGRDHLDSGSVASPYRETERMKDGSDAIADWPLLNAMLNGISGASWVSIHSGGGVGIGLSIHAGFVMVADGTKSAEKRIDRVLTNDPGTGVIRHADAGYDIAIDFAKRNNIAVPMRDE